MATRSPNYPQISFPDAVERIRRIYQKEHTHVTKDETFAKDLGYSGLNGASAGIVSALRKYGLLEGVKDNSKVSNDAVAIIELPSDEPQRVQAIRRSAFRPALFSEFFEKYGNRLPSDSNLRYTLLQKKFHPRTADELIRSYRETLEFVESEAPDYNEMETEAISDQEESPVQTLPQQTKGASQPLTFAYAGANSLSSFLPSQLPTEEKPMKKLTFLTLEADEAVLLLPSNITQESVDLIATLLAAQKVVFPTKAQLQAQTAVAHPEPILSLESAPAMESLPAPQLPETNQPLPDNQHSSPGVYFKENDFTKRN